MYDDNFAPLTDTELAAAPEAAPGKAWLPAAPVPDNAPTMTLTLGARQPDQQWAYRDQTGRLLGYVLRFNTPDGGKDIRPATFCTHASLPACWRFEGFVTPRPLYGLDRLASNPDANVIVCEGEKAADAATQIFKDHVCITSSGGAQAASKADWSALSGRSVWIWPDADAAGTSYAVSVVNCLRAVGAASVAVVDVGSMHDGWDLADELPDGMAPDDLHAMLDAATAQDTSLELPEGYQLRADGWYCNDAFIAGPFNIVGQSRDSSSDQWGLQLEWYDDDQQRHTWIMPLSALASDGTIIREQLLAGGLKLSSAHKHKQLLNNLLMSVKIKRRVLVVDQIGWRGNSFVMPARTYGPTADEKIELAAAISDDYATTGSLDEWQKAIAVPATGNSRLVLAISAAFAGPLMYVTDPTNFGIHLRGTSRSGKTTALRAAASVWGNGGDGGFIKTWRSTDNGLEGIAAARNDTLLCLDEMGQADSKVIGNSVYMLANGAGKQRASPDGSAREVKTWRMPFLSTGELSLEAKMLETGSKVHAGQEMRLLDIPADAGAGLGVFDDIGTFNSPQELADHITASASTFYGTPAAAFIDKLVSAPARDLKYLKRKHAEIRHRFRDEVVPSGASGQVASVSDRFAMIAFAGELAAQWRILPWSPGVAFDAAARCFRDWLGNRGSHGLHEVDAGLKQVGSFLQQYGESRFEQLSDEGIIEAYPLRDRAGFRTTEHGTTYFLVYPQVFKKEICQGFDAKLIAQTLRDRGHLRHADGRLQVQRRLPPESKKQWVYYISSSVLEGDDNAGR
jgi:putative DNA primase/helicase